MSEPGVEDALEALHARDEPWAVRFDGGEPLAGRVAVLPSAFNPPTLGHLGLLAVALSVEGVTAAAALLTTRNVAKGLHGATLAHRVGMLLAAREALAMAVLTTNMARFVDQALALRSAFPGAAFDFVAGYDTLVRIFDRRYYTAMEEELEPFFAHHRLIATNRAEAGLEEVEAVLAWPEARPFRDAVVVRELDLEAATHSSSAAREHLSDRGQTAILPASVLRYITEHRLYREK